MKIGSKQCKIVRYLLTSIISFLGCAVFIPTINAEEPVAPRTLEEYLQQTTQLIVIDCTNLICFSHPAILGKSTYLGQPLSLINEET